jgi:5-methyltetrahydropteroyltriglutamate--homocysteine methyltransferase
MSDHDTDILSRAALLYSGLSTARVEKGSMATAINLGFPRIGANRELKKATEAYWAKKLPVEALLAAARNIRRQNWTWQRDAGMAQVATGDFSFYDHVLDTSVLLDANPAR